MSSRPRITIITPALAAANNGNWQTAARWQRFLADQARVDCALEWDGAPADLMIALHARRSAASIAAFRQTGRPIALVLTGTDLYRDIRTDPLAQASLAAADALVCLQDQGPLRLDPSLRERTRVIYQSAPQLNALPSRKRTIDLALVGHLRPEKDPLTAIEALAFIDDSRVRLLQIGEARDAMLGAAVRRASERDHRIVMLGGLTHARTRGWIRRARALLLPSLMEGGANVVVEAATSGVPVLGSEIEGSVGMLGEDYAGFFPVGDARALARLVSQFISEPDFEARLKAQIVSRAALFEPALERRKVRDLARELLGR